MAVRLPSPVNEAQYIEIMDDEAYDGAVIANSLILYTGKFKHDALPEHGRHDPNVYMANFPSRLRARRMAKGTAVEIAQLIEKTPLFRGGDSRQFRSKNRSKTTCLGTLESHLFPPGGITEAI